MAVVAAERRRRGFNSRPERIFFALLCAHSALEGAVERGALEKEEEKTREQKGEEKGRAKTDDFSPVFLFFSPLRTLLSFDREFCISICHSFRF